MSVSVSCGLVGGKGRGEGVWERARGNRRRMLGHEYAKKGEVEEEDTGVCVCVCVCVCSLLSCLTDLASCCSICRRRKVSRCVLPPLFLPSVFVFSDCGKRDKNEVM